MADERTTISHGPEDRLHEAVASFEAARDAGLDPDPRAWLERYADVADALQHYFADQRGVGRVIQPPLPPPPGAGPPRPFGDYELLEELGRGGMGVVYRGRHVKLNRPVALKVILAGGHADAAARERFRAEAEAVARLQHPNVVQIHEVGEREGLPYLAL